jgi:hypothetical protein
VNEVAAESPQKVFGAMLAFFRSSADLTPEQPGTLVFLSGSQIRKVEAGVRMPREELVKACEDLPELGCNGALIRLYEILAKPLRGRGVYPGWFAAWPDRQRRPDRRGP